MFALTRWCNRIPRHYPEGGRSTLGGSYGDFSGFFWGGCEEQVIAKGSPWPQELCRVLASLLQLAAIPARLVFLYRREPPLLHTVVEAWPQDGWSVCDPCANRCYLWPHRGYASALQLQQYPGIWAHAPERGRHPYVDPALYGLIGICEYPLATAEIRESPMPARVQDRGPIERALEAFTTP
jgi:hypothetical protein